MPAVFGERMDVTSQNQSRSREILILALQEQLEALNRLGALTRLMADLGSAHNAGELLQRALVGLPRVVDPIQRGEILLADATGTLASAATFGNGPRLLIDGSEVGSGPLLLDGGRRLLPDQLAEGVPRLLPADPETGTGAIAFAPVVDGPQLLGVLAVERAAGGPDFSAADLDAVGRIATQLAMVLQRVRAEQRSTEHSRVERDLQRARQIQRRFLPTLPSVVGGMRVAAEYLPAFEVGGDFYDLVPTSDGRLVAFIGDVSGKGVAAALIMARVMSEFRRIAHESTSPAEMLSQLNRAMSEQGHDDAFVTATCLQIDPSRRRLRVANAGHVPPMLRRADRRVELLGQDSGAPLGMLAVEVYGEQVVDIDQGDIILLMTDGITETLDRYGDPLDMDLLVNLIAQSPHDVGEIRRTILDEVERTGRRLPDDIALLALQVPELQSLT